MTGVRVSDLAKELEMSADALMEALNDLGVPVPGPAAIVDADTAQALREMYATPEGDARVVEVSANATVKDIAEAIGAGGSEVQRKLMQMGILASVNQRLTTDQAKQLAGAFGVSLRIKVEPRPAAPAAATRAKGPSTGPQPRPPIVTILGHVDHGKTTLLDHIRNSHVVDGEFGGITQHIGAYQVELDFNGERRKITFIDTPGHAAFTQMRARGASVTDIAILVVAADDGIMPQTIEAIDHARAAEVPIIVAINKCDRPDANPDRIKTQLTEYGLVPTDYGGETECVPISAKQGTGIDDLLELIVYTADLLELKGDTHARAKGTIIEARQEPGRGPVATVLVQQGTLRTSDCVICGLAYGKVRAMTNERGERLTKATPATPVELTGLSAVPQAGDRLEVVKDEREARTLAEQRAVHQREASLGGRRRMTLEDIARQIQQGETKELKLIVKADVHGSIEAVVGQLMQLPQGEVTLQVMLTGVGNVSESDVTLASASGAVVIGFNVKADNPAIQAAERQHVDIRTFQIIYELTDAVERTMKGMLDPIYEEVALGKAEVRAMFRTPRGVVIAGCYVTDGKIIRNAEARVRRGRDLIAQGKISSLKHVKDDVREMAQGFECGIVVDDYMDVQVGDQIEAFEQRQIER